MSRKVVPPNFDFVQKPKCADGEILHGGDYCSHRPNGYVYRVEAFCENGDVIAFCPVMGYVRIRPEHVSHVKHSEVKYSAQGRVAALIEAVSRALDLR